MKSASKKLIGSTVFGLCSMLFFLFFPKTSFALTVFPPAGFTILSGVLFFGGLGLCTTAIVGFIKNLNALARGRKLSQKSNTKLLLLSVICVFLMNLLFVFY